jgi:histidine ammonia-lyase
MQGIQFTATSTVAENQTLSFPAYIHSISCNNDNQDIVSMGTTAALIARKVIENSYEVLAIELIAVLQAVDYLDIEKKLSTFNRSVFNEVREIIPKFINDRVMSEEIRKVKEHLLRTRKKIG